MWSKQILAVTYRVSKPTALRLLHHIHPSSQDSYLNNPGLEPLTNATFGEVVAQTVHKYPGRIAVRSIHEDLTLTYQQLLTQADALACSLRAQGLEKGDRVGLWTHNSSSWIVAAVAAARAGLIAVAINPVYEKSELLFCINKVGMKTLLIGEQLPNKDYFKLLSDILPELHTCRPGSLASTTCPTLRSVITTGHEKLPGTFTLKSLISENERGDASKFNNEISPQDGSFIHFTSGTTGEPKAGLDSHMGLVNNSYFVGKRMNFHEEHHTLCMQAPMFHALGSVVSVFAALRYGASLVLPSPTYNLQANVNAFMAESDMSTTGTPTMYVDMLTAVRSKGAEPRIRLALQAGAPCSPQLILDMKKYLKCQYVLGLYGMTEATACIFQSLPNDSLEQIAETVGYIQDHVEVKVVDENGKQVPFGSPGELMSRGYNTMIEYWADPEKTRQTIDKDGWLKTGDKFTISEDGYGRVVGRLKDIIIRGGENIAPKEIEDLLNTHPDIIESQVVGIADARLGEELCVVLRVHEGASVDAAEIARHCTGRLARFKIPRLVKVTDEFPKTASGKIQKFKLKEMVESGKL